MTYEVGAWFIYLIDGAILAVIGIVLLILIMVKRGKYQKEATNCIRAEIQLPTGWSNYFTIPCDSNAKSVSIDNSIYLLDPNKRRWGRHPMNPFMGLTWLQVPIRIETWSKDIPEPLRLEQKTTIATADEIKAITREIQATNAAMMIQELESQQKELVNAISNQPNKILVYVLMGIAVAASIGSLIMIYQLAGRIPNPSIAVETETAVSVIKLITTGVI